LATVDFYHTGFHCLLGLQIINKFQGYLGVEREHS
jgi:hypothetical protein